MKQNMLLSNNQIFKSEISKIMQKVALQEAPLSILSVFQEQRRPGGMNTRSNSNIFIPFSKKSKCMQAMSYSGPKIWNSLPDDIKKLNSDLSSIENQLSFSPYKVFCKSIKSHALSTIEFI